MKPKLYAFFAITFSLILVVALSIFLVFKYVVFTPLNNLRTNWAIEVPLGLELDLQLESELGFQGDGSRIYILAADQVL